MKSVVVLSLLAALFLFCSFSRLPPSAMRKAATSPAFQVSETEQYTLELFNDCKGETIYLDLTIQHTAKGTQSRNRYHVSETNHYSGTGYGSITGIDYRISGTVRSGFNMPAAAGKGAAVDRQQEQFVITGSDGSRYSATYAQNMVVTAKGAVRVYRTDFDLSCL